MTPSMLSTQMKNPKTHSGTSSTTLRGICRPATPTLVRNYDSAPRGCKEKKRTTRTIPRKPSSTPPTTQKANAEMEADFIADLPRPINDLLASCAADNLALLEARGFLLWNDQQATAWKLEFLANFFQSEETGRNEFVKSIFGRSACKCVRRAWVHCKAAWESYLDNNTLAFDIQWLLKADPGVGNILSINFNVSVKKWRQDMQDELISLPGTKAVPGHDLLEELFQLKLEAT